MPKALQDGIIFLVPMFALTHDKMYEVFVNFKTYLWVRMYSFDYSIDALVLKGWSRKLNQINFTDTYLGSGKAFLQKSF